MNILEASNSKYPPKYSDSCGLLNYFLLNSFVKL